jgi:ligand-binding sensor domain-containing protein/two-component sensor histidine kinase
MLLWGIAALLHVVCAQPLNLAFHRLGRKEGLSQGTCPYVSRDSRGFVWIASLDGLNRFDGQRVKVYRPNPSVPHSMVGNIVTSSCYEDPATGDLWFTTYNAIHRYVRAFDHFDTFQLKNKAHERLVEDYYAFHFDPGGRLWLRAGSGDAGYLHWFDTRTGGDSIVCPMNGARSAVIPGKNGVIKQVLCSAIDTTGMEVTDLANGFVKHIYLQGGSTACVVQEVFVENDTLVWLGLSNGIAAFNPQAGALQVYDTFEGRPSGSVWSVAPYNNHLLFVATKKDGLWLFDRRSRQFVQRFVHEPDNPYSLLDNETKNLYIDRQENLWAAHWRYGLSYVNLRKNKFCIPPTAKGNSFWQFLKGPDGNIWCSEPEKGLFVYAPDGRLMDTMDNYFPAIKRRLSFTAPLVFPGGGPMGLYMDNLLRWDATQHSLKWVKKMPQKMTGACVTPGGETIMATAQGIFRWASDGGENISLVPIPLHTPSPTKQLAAIFCDSRGRLYLAENMERLLVFEKKAEGFVLIKTIEGTGDCKGFLEKPDGKGLWVACTAGLLNIGPELEARLLNESADGLPGATYYAVLPDRRGHLWLSSNQGLLRYDPVRHSTIRYMPVDGLFGSEFNKGSFYQAADGTIWMGGVGGLVFFHPDSIRTVPFEPQVQITQILINDQPSEGVPPAETTDVLDLPYSQNTLSFEFVALEFSDPVANQFQYRLVGYDDGWVKSGTRGFARYANLPPGQYVFEVLAANADGVWSTTPKSLTINIQTPFYKTWWFYLLCAFAIGGLVYAWLWYRLQHALKIERMRVQISSDLHDDVGTLLAGLAMQSEALELTASDKDRTKLRRISDISRNAMAHMRDTVWAIDARKDKVENLLDRMREHAEETLTPRDFHFDIQVENIPLKQNLSTQVRQNLYLIFKEAVTNVARHSNGDKVLVTLKKADTGFEMRIWDNGRTAEKTYKTTGLGTTNMSMRAEKMGGRLEISRNDGFCVVLRLAKLG